MRKREALANACRHLMLGRNGLIVTYKDIEKDFAAFDPSGLLQAEIGEDLLKAAGRMAPQGT